MLNRLLTLTICLMVLAPCARAEEASFEMLTKEAISYFSPMEGSVLASAGQTFRADLSGETGLKPGMRLDIFRKGTAFLHPITKEVIGQSEELTGSAEAIQVDSFGSTFRVLAGEAHEGDTLRLSSAPVRAVFYQSSDVNWNLAEEYHLHLKEAERFELLDAVPGKLPDSAIIEQARAMNAAIIIIVSSGTSIDDGSLSQRLLWVENPKELSSMEIRFDKETVEKYTLGDEYFTPEATLSERAFTLPHTGRLVGAGDFDGDGTDELVVALDGTLLFYTIGASLVPALDGIEVKTGKTETPVRLDIDDVDGDGQDEIVLTSLVLMEALDDELIESRPLKRQARRVISRVLDYQNQKRDFQVLWEGPVYVRAIDGVLYAQEFSRSKGFRGKVFTLHPKAEEPRGTELQLPEGLGIYDFTFVDTPEGGKALVYYDRRGHISLADETGTHLWRGGFYGKPSQNFEQEQMETILPADEWYINDAMLRRGGAVYALRREARTAVTGSLGYKNSQVVVLSVAEDLHTIQERVLKDNIPGDVRNFALSGDKLFVLVRSFKVTPMNIFRGRSPFKSVLLAYKVRGL
jgi:hypothetical protein